MSLRRATLDIGSNSTLLLVAELQNNVWTPVYEASRVTGLGSGTKTSRRLSPIGAASTLETLKDFFALAQEHGATNILAAGTMALRIADDAPEFLRAAREQGTPLTIISGEEEAHLGFLAVANDPLLANHPRLSIIDPGGHSTELVTADRTATGWDTLFCRSYPIGALGLRETLLPDETPSFSQRLNAVQALDELIGLEYRPHTSGVAVTLGATGTNLISIREKLTVWQPDRVHGQILDFEEVSKAVGFLCDLTDTGRATVPGIEPGRERTLHIGALILERFLWSLHVLDCVVSVRGWRHALLESPDFDSHLKTLN